MADPIHLLEKHLPEIIFDRKTFFRIYICPKLHLPERTLSRKYICQNMHLTEVHLPERTID